MVGRSVWASVHLKCLFIQILCHLATADVYLHIPRGSNNRLLGERANRQNANRVFDSQNNAKGGYNAPEKTKDKSKDWFHMKYYMSGPNEGKTKLSIEWTNQHGCGHEDLNCNIVLQYKCQPTTVTDQNKMMRNGINENKPPYGRKTYQRYGQKLNEVGKAGRRKRVINEPWEWYDKCAKRQRNKGLFTADQQLGGEEAKYTRQNPNGDRYGYECPEERDYYPYWHPTDWIDIAVLANSKDDCSYYKKESFNTAIRGECMELYPVQDKRHPDHIWKHASKHNNKTACEANGGKWVGFRHFLEIVNKTKEECTGRSLIWDIPYRSEDLDQFEGENPEKWKRCLVKLPEPECYEAPKTRTNHLGNGENVVPVTHEWILPHWPSGEEQRCVLRIRYNISTNDYDPKNTFSSSNNQDDVIENDPVVEVSKGNNNKVPLQLAINTAQFGRTFQDRSHIFGIIPRKDDFQDCVIHNVNVKGKRGNIVQVYPAVEYDFTPKNLKMKSSECVHIQFAGSNRNPRGNAGEGRDQTDRNNLVAMASPDVNYPLKDTSNTLFDVARVIDAPDPDDFASTKTGADIAIAMATAGYFKTASAVPSPFRVEGCNDDGARKLDCYPASWSGLLLKISTPGLYHYMCSRNNNFTNRNQKASLEVTQG